MRARLAAWWEVVATAFNGPRCTHGNFTGSWGYNVSGPFKGGPSSFSDCPQCRRLARELHEVLDLEEAQYQRSRQVSIVRDGILAAWKVKEKQGK